MRVEYTIHIQQIVDRFEFRIHLIPGDERHVQLMTPKFVGTENRFEVLRNGIVAAAEALLVLDANISSLQKPVVKVSVD